MKKCLCNCGGEIIGLRTDGKPKFYLHGHNNKGEYNSRLRKATVLKRTSHERANKICKEIICRLNNQDCKGRLDVAHLNQNPFDNKVENLAKLCRSHHFILDKRKITIQDLQILRLQFRTDSSGKRRYKIEV